MTIRRGEINLYVSDIPRAVDFYVKALGMKRVADPVFGEPDASWDKVGSGELTLTLFKAQSAERAVEPGARPGMTADLIVDDLDAALRRLAEAGAKVGPVRAWKMGRVMNVMDPDGNSWELISREKAAPVPEARHLVLYASNLKRARGFYAKTLGFPLLEDAPNFFAVRAGPVRISVSGGGRKVKRGVPNVRVVLEVRDIEAAVKRLKAKKVKFLGKIEEAAGFMKHVALADPDNNPLVLAQYLRDPLLPCP